MGCLQYVLSYLMPVGLKRSSGSERGEERKHSRRCALPLPWTALSLRGCACGAKKQTKIACLLHAAIHSTSQQFLISYSTYRSTLRLISDHTETVLTRKLQPPVFRKHSSLARFLRVYEA